MSVTFTDSFCGFGGSSQGLTEAGFELVWAANHWDRAIETHAANFPHADHFQGDLSGFDMRRMPRADMAWLSPECTWHSPAGGRKRVRAELDLFDDYVPDAAGERSRATMWDVVRAAEAKQFKVVIVENVVEVTSWPLFDSWLGAMTALGYSHQIVCVTAAHVGGELNPYAPQWRDRIYFVFYKQGIPMPRIEPRPLAWCEQCGRDVEARQSWKRSDRRRIGKYGQQYVYVHEGPHAPQVVEPYVLPAAAAIDWSDLGTRIGDRDKPLAAATVRRIEAGIRMFARPVVAAAAGQTYDAASKGQPRKFYRMAPADSAPFDTRLTSITDGLAVPPFVTNVRHGTDDHGRQFEAGAQPLPPATTKIGDGLVVPAGGSWNDSAYPMSDPLRARLTRDSEGMLLPPLVLDNQDHAGGDERRVKTADSAPLGTIVANARHHQLVVPPMVTMLRSNGATTPTDDEPLATLTTGRNHAVVAPEGAFISRGYGSRGNGLHLNTSPSTPLHPITASGGGNHALVIPYRRGRASRAGDGPLPTVTTTRTAAVLEPDWTADELAEIVLNSRFRMLGPREHLRAQRFPDSYIVKGNKGEQTKGAGNAVASNVAHWLGTYVLAALGTQSERAA